MGQRGGDERALFYEGFARDWDAAMDPDELGKRLRLVFGRLLREEDVRGRRVLDAGAGTGHFSRRLCAWGARATAMDLGNALLSEVSAKCGAALVCASLLDLPFPDGAFEAVLCTEVIEHTPEPRRAVRELCRVVGPGGVLALTVPNRVWRPAVLAANALRLRPYKGYENWVGYAELRGWLSAAGLRVEESFGFNLLPHTRFCRPRFDFLDRVAALHPYMINIGVRARRPL